MKHEATGTRAITLWCRSWSCTDCMPYRLAALKRFATSGQPTTFLTLTVNPAHGQSPEGRARELVEAMRTMMKRAARKFSKSRIAYFAVFEETKKGEPHLHMLLRAPFVPQKWISATMDELIEAPIVDIRKVTRMTSVAKYVAKYVAKGPKSFGTLKRYWSTQDYSLDAKRAHRSDDEMRSTWWVVQEPLWALVESWNNLCRAVEWVTPHEIFSGNGAAWRRPET